METILVLIAVAVIITVGYQLWWKYQKERQANQDLARDWTPSVQPEPVVETKLETPVTPVTEAPAKKPRKPRTKKTDKSTKKSAKKTGR